MSIFEPDREDDDLVASQPAPETEILTDTKWFKPFPDEIEDRWDDELR